MKKAIVLSAIGPQYKKMYGNVAPTFERYASKYGWDIKVNYEIPDWFSKKYNREKWDFRLLCCAYRLYQPIVFSDYELLALMDPDMIINPDAPCLSSYYNNIPYKGFAAVQSDSFLDRKMFKNWNKYYYNDFLKVNEVDKIKFPKLHINAGLILVKPADIKDDWLKLVNMDSDFNDEQRINLYLTQAGKAFILPEKWNVIYPYELARRGYNFVNPSSSKIIRKIKYYLFKYLVQENMIENIFSDVYILHFASTNKNIVTNLDVNKLIDRLKK